MPGISIIDPSNGSTLRVIGDPLKGHVLRQIIRYMVSRTITCPFAGEILDYRSCVAIVTADDDVKSVMSPAGWLKVRENWPAVAERFPGAGITSGRASSLKVD